MVSSLLATKAAKIQKTIIASSLRHRCCFSSSVPKDLLHELRQLDTACICDADKIMLNSSEKPATYKGVKVLHPSIRPVMDTHNSTMVGIARTVQCTRRNDFLAVLRGLLEAQVDEVLMVNTSDSSHAVAGELFATEAVHARGLAGLVVDGPVRDTAQLRELLANFHNYTGTNEQTNSSFRVYASSITPYSGTTDSPGRMQEMVTCGGVPVHVGDIVMGDNDGVIVASRSCMETLLPTAQEIFATEARIRTSLMQGTGTLESLTNATEHVKL